MKKKRKSSLGREEYQCLLEDEIMEDLTNIESGICDNTDHNSSKRLTYRAVLRQEFRESEDDNVLWCKDCIKRDCQMVEEILPIQLKIKER